MLTYLKCTVYSLYQSSDRQVWRDIDMSGHMYTHTLWVFHWFYNQAHIVKSCYTQYTGPINKKQPKGPFAAISYGLTSYLPYSLFPHPIHPLWTNHSKINNLHISLKSYAINPFMALWRISACVRMCQGNGGREYRRLIGQCIPPFPQGHHAPILFFSKEEPMAVLINEKRHVQRKKTPTLFKV